MIAVVLGTRVRDVGADPNSGEVIVITGLRLPRAVIDTPAATRVIDRPELAHAPAALADDVLRAAPQVGTFRRSSSWIADPTSQGLNLRGIGPSGVSRALVLRDGIPENDPFGGWIYWRAISPLALDRVEITPSGASALFGDFALGGVVQLVSRSIERRGVSALLSGGSYGTAHGALRATERRGGLGLSLDADLARSGGYAPIAPARRGAVDGRAGSAHAAIAGRVEQHLGDSTIHATARYFRESLDAGTAHTTADVQTIALATGWRAPGIEVELFGGMQRFAQERARVSSDRSTAATASEQRTPSNNQGGLVTWSTSVSTHALSLGGDLQRITGHATDHLSPPMIGDRTVVERTAGGEQHFAGLFVQDAWSATPRVELTAALRLDAWQNVGGERTIVRGNGDREVTALAETSDVQLDPRVGVLAHVSDAFALRASAYRAFRAPTLNELYRPFQVGTILTAANDRLRAETLWGAEAGPQVVVSGIVVRATGFYNRLEDPITNVTLEMPDPSGATRRRDNLGRARIVGLELDASWHPVPRWTFGIAHLFSDATVQRAPGAPMLVGNRLAQDPRQRMTADVTFDDPRLLTATVQLRYLGRQFEDDLNTLPIGAVVLVDARVARRLAGRLSAFASVTNLTDRRYLVGRAGIDTLGTPRMFELGVLLN